MSEVKHSPLPWKIDDNGSVVDSGGRSVVVAGFAYQIGYAPKECTGRINDRFIVSSVNAHAAVEAMAEALEEATQSLETIERLAGKKEEGLACFVDVRGYAHSRATVARKSLAAYRATQNKDVRP